MEEIKYEDKVLKCVICGKPFTLESGEQYFYHERGLAEPKRCPTCREAKRKAIGGRWG